MIQIDWEDIFPDCHDPDIANYPRCRSLKKYEKCSTCSFNWDVEDEEW